MKCNILLVGLDYEFTQGVALELSSLFDMFYLDIKGLISYTLSSKQEVVDKAGVAYFDNQVQKLVLSASEYENTIINMPYDLYIKDDNSTKLNQTCFSIFLNLNKQALMEQDATKDSDKKLTIPLLVFEDLSQKLQTSVEHKIDLTNANIEACINKIIDLLKKQ